VGRSESVLLRRYVLSEAGRLFKKFVPRPEFEPYSTNQAYSKATRLETETPFDRSRRDSTGGPRWLGRAALAKAARASCSVALDRHSCEYPIPAPAAGQALNPDRVNVLYTPDGGATETVARDPSIIQCEEGWQYSGDGQICVVGRRLRCGLRTAVAPRSCLVTRRQRGIFTAGCRQFETVLPHSSQVGAPRDTPRTATPPTRAR